MNKANTHSFLPKVITFYMLAALLWWSFLLFKKNKEITSTKLELLQLERNVIEKTNDAEIKSLSEYEFIIKKHKRQQYMIIGEGLVFALTLIIGISLINKAHLKQLENQNKQNNFLLSVTHELRSPLSSIILILDTIKKRVLPKEKITELANDALSEGERLNQQIHNMLFATKLDNSYAVNKQNIDAKKIIQKLIHTYNAQYPEVKFNLLYQAQDIILADKEGFYSMVDNLIENAIKYSPKGEQQVDIEVKELPTSVSVSIKDQGIGIEDTQKNEVTKQFYRIGNENTRKTKGTGLGLYIVDKLVKSHNGKLLIKNNQPKGTIFEINLPKK